MTDKVIKPLVIATRNQGKIDQFSRILGVPVVGKNLEVPEIQSEDPMTVLMEKAKTAWRLNGNEPILVEDSVLQCPALFDLPGPFADQFTNSYEKRKLLCEILIGRDRTAIFQVGVAFYNGRNIQHRIGITKGSISSEPRGDHGFGFDDIFIPEGQPGDAKTYAEMSKENMDKYSPRRAVIEALRDNPFLL